MMKFTIILLIAVLCSQHAGGMQLSDSYGKKDTILTPTYLFNSELLPYKKLENIRIVPKHLTKQEKKRLAYNYRVYTAVRKTYVFSKIATQLYDDIKRKEKEFNDKRALRKYIKTREQEMKRQFAGKLTKLTVFQGKVLMKLFYRQEGETCHQLLKDYKGSLNAAFWQSIAFIFGSSLKQTYDPSHDKMDRLIEQSIERYEGKYYKKYVKNY